jgi:hypothetical protein
MKTEQITKEEVLELLYASIQNGRIYNPSQPLAEILTRFGFQLKQVENSFGGYDYVEIRTR